METPLSSRRVAGSQAIFPTNNSDSLRRTEDSSFSQRKNNNAQEDRSALTDITNDSPIVGLTMQTPPSGFVCKKKNSRIIKSTPGSGEALLRGQVKTLLDRVEEGTELITHSIKSLPFIHLVTSPMRLLAPTPANTPQFPNFSDDKVQIKIASPVVAGHLRTSQIFEEKEGMSMSISRSLLFDFTDKPAALWDEEEEVEKTQAEFAGKHSRFVYNSEDDEIVEAKKVCY
ncbi:BnaA01g19550D [Brassica napus]|uniref:BnaA01g19550D protein n=1 Tax=Brassica napus TaxID=3708 RepID=A0A078H8W1_BRANA|nr:BnaA01g19550D [Brassica napus]